MYTVTHTNGIDNRPQMLHSSTWMKDYCVDGTKIIDEANNINNVTGNADQIQGYGWWATFTHEYNFIHVVTVHPC